MAIDYGKAKKILTETFLEECNDLNEDSASKLIVDASQKIRDLEDEQSQDEELLAAKQVVKDLSAGYTSTIKYEKAKISFLLGEIDRIREKDSTTDTV